MDAYSPTPRSRVRRLPKRGRYDRATIHAILDAGFICHVGYVIDGQPYVTPTAYWRDGDRVFWHGSSASRMLRAQATGIPVCLTVTHVDGLVAARSAFHHTINYRSVMLFGAARKIEERGAKLSAMHAFVERVYPGRWAVLRPVYEKEIKATTILAMVVEEASAKVRTGPPIDDEPDYALPIWAGVVPFRTMIGEPIADPRLQDGIAPTPDIARYRPGSALEAAVAGVREEPGSIRTEMSREAGPATP